MVDDSIWSCAGCLKEAICQATGDPTARSDALRPHRAWAKGFDRTKVDGIQVAIPLGDPSPAGITFAAVKHWEEAALAAGMKPATLAQYQYASSLCWPRVNCVHQPGGSAISVGGGDSDSKWAPLPPFTASSEGLEFILEGPRPSVNSESVGGDLSEMSLRGEPMGEEVDRGRIGFKLSVAQKFLSLVLKHAWVNGYIEEPPVSPVDRIVLNAASQITGRRWTTNWTEVNRIEDYDAHLELLTAAAGFRRVAAWELLTFEGAIAISPLNNLVAPNQRRAELALDEASRIDLAKVNFIHRFGSGQPGHSQWPAAMLTDALKSSLQHNPLYLPTTQDFVRIEIRNAMRQWGIEFLRRWKGADPADQTVERFRSEILAFRKHMNEKYARWFR